MIEDQNLEAYAYHVIGDQSITVMECEEFHKQFDMPIPQLALGEWCWIGDWWICKVKLNEHK
jgi:hypothetical protein